MRGNCFHRSLSAKALLGLLGLGSLMLSHAHALAQAGAQAGGAPARLETVAVALDHARVVKLPERTATVIVGNPMIADVAVQKNGILVVTGKSYGQTNLIALDSNGAMLAESQISVRQGTDGIMTVQRGLDRESYSCTPHCQPAIQLGDAAKHFGDTSGQVTARNAAAGTGK